jgi:hypothetical protein
MESKQTKGVDMQTEHVKDPQAVLNGQRGGRLRMAQLNPQERSALAKHAAQARWHPLQAKAQRERAEEIARVVKQAIDDYLPSNKRDLMQP